MTRKCYRCGKNRANGQHLRFFALCVECVTAGYRLELYKPDPYGIVDTRWYVGIFKGKALVDPVQRPGSIE